MNYDGFWQLLAAGWLSAWCVKYTTPNSFWGVFWGCTLGYCIAQLIIMGLTT